MLYFQLLPAFLISFLVLCIDGYPTFKYRVHERRSSERIFRRRLDRPSPSIAVSVTVALKQDNLDRGHAALLEIRDSSSKYYGKHWTQAEVAAAFSPSRQSPESVRNWTRLSIEGPLQLSKGRNSVSFTATLN